MASQLHRIVHVDMDAFFASVEQRDFPELRGKPVIVGGSKDGRGVVATASYEARKFGVHSAMSSRTASRLCPEGIFVKPHFEVYRQVSKQIMQIFSRYTDLIEPLSIDEAFLDVTENKIGLKFGSEIAKLIKSDIFRETGLTASAGVAPNKFLAKIASGFRKPNGLTIIAPERMERFLVDLSVRNFPGVGPVTEKRLHDLGIKTTKDLREWSEEALVYRLGKYGGWLYKICRGDDSREVQPARERKSLGAEDTFESDLSDPALLTEEVDRIANIVSERLTARGLSGPTVTLKVTFSDFEKVTRSETGSRFISSPEEISKIARGLLFKTDAVRSRPVRLLGIQISGFKRGLLPPRQLMLSFH